MTEKIVAELPPRLLEEAREHVRFGWAVSLDELIADALRRYLDNHTGSAAETFLRADVEWGLHGHD